MKILVVNAGSSTHKCAIFENHEKIPYWTGFLDWGLNSNEVRMLVKTKHGENFEKILPLKPVFEIMKELIETAGSLTDLKGVAHRVVHGGDKFKIPTLITKEVKDVIRDLIKLAPLHNPANLRGIEIMQQLFPNTPQVAVFDTAFHSQIPEVASTYALPQYLREEGIKRYGFHGISHEYCMNRALEMIPKSMETPKIVTCHLGNGASLAAIKNGHSIDTTMGFTPMEGLMMGTRSGSIDPGILLYLQNQKDMNTEILDRCLNFESGLKGISGGVSDMRKILKKIGEGDRWAKLGFDMFIYSLNSFIGKMTASLQGLDVLVFTAGIGENSREVREKSCIALKYLGVDIDLKKNALCDEDTEISTPKSKVHILVIHTKEEYAIKEKALQFLI